MNNVTVTVSPQSKVEFLMLVNLAMGLAVGQSLEIRDTTYCSYITFKDTPSQVLFFSELHVQWYNKDLKPVPVTLRYENSFCTISETEDGRFERYDKILKATQFVDRYTDDSEVVHFDAATSSQFSK